MFRTFIILFFCLSSVKGSAGGLFRSLQLVRNQSLSVVPEYYKHMGVYKYAQGKRDSILFSFSNDFSDRVNNGTHLNSEEWLKVKQTFLSKIAESNIFFASTSPLDEEEMQNCEFKILARETKKDAPRCHSERFLLDKVFYIQAADVRVLADVVKSLQSDSVSMLRDQQRTRYIIGSPYLASELPRQSTDNDSVDCFAHSDIREPANSRGKHLMFPVEWHQHHKLISDLRIGGSSISWEISFEDQENAVYAASLRNNAFFSWSHMREAYRQACVTKNVDFSESVLSWYSRGIRAATTAERHCLTRYLKEYLLDTTSITISKKDLFFEKDQSVIEWVRDQGAVVDKISLKFEHDFDHKETLFRNLMVFLRGNHLVKELDLHTNEVTIFGLSEVSFLASVLESNSTLERVHLSGFAWSEKSIAMLLDAISRNTSSMVTKLDLGMNNKNQNMEISQQVVDFQSLMSNKGRTIPLIMM